MSTVEALRILGFNTMSEVSMDLLKNKKRSLLKLYHPDVSGSLSNEDYTIKIIEAYECVYNCNFFNISNFDFSFDTKGLDNYNILTIEFKIFKNEFLELHRFGSVSFENEVIYSFISAIYNDFEKQNGRDVTSLMNDYDLLVHDFLIKLYYGVFKKCHVKDVDTLINDKIFALKRISKSGLMNFLKVLDDELVDMQNFIINVKKVFGNYSYDISKVKIKSFDDAKNAITAFCFSKVLNIYLQDMLVNKATYEELLESRKVHISNIDNVFNNLRYYFESLDDFMVYNNYSDDCFAKVYSVLLNDIISCDLDYDVFDSKLEYTLEKYKNIGRVNEDKNSNPSDTVVMKSEFIHQVFGNFSLLFSLRDSEEIPDLTLGDGIDDLLFSFENNRNLVVFAQDMRRVEQSLIELFTNYRNDLLFINFGESDSYNKLLCDIPVCNNITEYYNEVHSDIELIRKEVDVNKFKR